jgi:hypothetical protein
VWVQQNSRINSKQIKRGRPLKLEIKLEIRSEPKGALHELNLKFELQLKTQGTTELAQQNKKLLLAEWAAQVSDKEA